jgi:hypothetical protein
MSNTLGGYAPGDYSCTCSFCGREFSGDKRAIDCLQCAGIAQFKAGMERAAVIAWELGWGSVATAIRKEIK